METEVYTFRLELNWQLINLISQIDRFDASWQAIEKKEGATLKELKTISTVRSVGASTRIEGSGMSDEEVAVLLKQIDISKLEDRDSQEVAGYFETLDLISEAFADIEINEGNLKNLHNTLLRYSKKDDWHRGNYKQHPNAVEAQYPDGSRQVIFKTTQPGWATESAMKSLINWYEADKQTHTLVKCALFTYDFLSVHPFQDGNGRLSRLISTLLLLRQDYRWIQYVSFEHEIESRKTAYYSVLRSCQAQRPQESVSEWVIFFLDCLKNIQIQLMQKLEVSGVENQLSVREKSVLTFIQNHPGSKSGEIAEKVNIPPPTVKKILPVLIEKKLIVKHGTGPGTYYTVL
jgi:Fic family protein